MSAPPPSADLIEIVLPQRHGRTCCSCLASSPAEYHTVADDAECLRVSALMGMSVPLGAVFCLDPVSPCWSRKHNRPLWAAAERPHARRSDARLAYGRRAAGEHGHSPSVVDPARVRVDEIDPRTRRVPISPHALAVLQAAWRGALALARDRNAASSVLARHTTMEVDAAQSVCAAARKERTRSAPDWLASSTSEVSARLHLEHLLSKQSQLCSLTGAPSTDKLLALVNEAFPRTGGLVGEVGDLLATWPSASWVRTSAGPLTATCVALAHLRGGIPFDALAGVFHLSSKSIAFYLTEDVICRFAELATNASFPGAVTFRSRPWLRANLPARFSEIFPDLVAVIDCFPVFTTRVPSNSNLTHALFDGVQHPGTWWTKWLVVTAPNGYIMHINGPFAPASKACDGRVLTYAMLSDDDFWQFAVEGGTWLVDYGFRGVFVPEDVVVHMPKKWHTKTEVAHAATTAQIMHNHAVCSARWVVELVNERVKNWAVFAGAHRPWTEVLKMRQWILVVSFLHNRWRLPLFER
jgi:hypothetical protein